MTSCDLELTCICATTLERSSRSDLLESLRCTFAEWGLELNSGSSTAAHSSSRSASRYCRAMASVFTAAFTFAALIAQTIGGLPSRKWFTTAPALRLMSVS